MKKIALFTTLIIGLLGCTSKGTLGKLNTESDPAIEVYKYWYTNGSYVYVARFKDQPNITTTTWQSGKHQQASVFIGDTLTH